ncbi:hypothetical protein MFIFM68171_03913 [Madurella fahalii]|uniref:Uncharacterized protein n=1 Tax=Madurella fahalii TaxID=1157608 RepID=A0ABQ0G7G1_9PEZI
MPSPNTMEIKRVFKQEHTFSDGTHKAGSYALTWRNSNGLRAYRARLGSVDALEERDNIFQQSGTRVVNFGYGETTCPERLSGSVVGKMVTVETLTEYEFKVLDGQGPPGKIMEYEFCLLGLD